MIPSLATTWGNCLRMKSEQKHKSKGWRKERCLHNILDPLFLDTPQSILSLTPTWGYSPSFVYTSLIVGLLQQFHPWKFLCIRFHCLFHLLLCHPCAPTYLVICTEWMMDGHLLFMKGSRQVAFSELEDLLLRLPYKILDAQLSLNFRY